MEVGMEGLIQNEYFHFALIILGSLIISKVVHIIIVRYLRSIAARTKTDIDDMLLKIIIKPVCGSIILIGLYFGLQSLSALTLYSDYIKGAYFVVMTILIALIISSVLSILISRWLRVQKKFEKMPKLISNLVALGIYLLAVLMILRHFNIDISPLLLSFGVGGLAIGLALQNTLANLFGGLHLLSDRPINVGDFIDIEGGISGFVEDIGWRSTRIRTLPNTYVVVPNSKLADSIIVNNSLPVQEMSVVVQCGVAYESDLDKVERITNEVGKRIQETVPGAVKTFEPFIRYHTFGDSNINFSIILRVEEPTAKYLVMHEFIKALKRRYDEEGIEISWPVRKVYYRR